MQKQNDLKGLGGWLIIVGVQVVLFPIVITITFAYDFLPLIQKGNWEALIKFGSEAYTPLFRMLIIGETFFNLSLLIVSLYQVHLFFNQHYLFPKIFIAILTISLIYILVDAWIASLILPKETMFEPQTIGEIAHILIACLIWIPYMLESKRVKATFVGKKPSDYLDVATLETERYCANCGVQLPENGNYCINCGSEILKDNDY